MLISGCDAIASVTRRREPSRSTASAAPAGTRALVGRAHDQRAEPPHLLLQEADGVIELVAAEGIGADELGEPIGLVDRGRLHRPHLVEHDGDAARRGLPGGFAPGQAAADDENVRTGCHDPKRRDRDRGRTKDRVLIQVASPRSSLLSAAQRGKGRGPVAKQREGEVVWSTSMLSS